MIIIQDFASFLGYQKDVVWETVGLVQVVTVIECAGDIETAVGMFLECYDAALKVIKTACMSKANRDSKSNDTT
ncbi:MAG: hypothetical protein A6F71_10020 [Cycloclasticus sp. symbiont of Poecilosclerida sp. M]|nr:MAG: hypothetical protein A6F71_10020 [Cycloclasticus sp. symbiont of Poecilosclerida sp. M]